MLDPEEELRAELRALLDTYFEQDPVTFLPYLQALQNRVRDLTPSLSHDTLQLAHNVAHALASMVTGIINVTERSQQYINKTQNEIERALDFKMEYIEHEEELSEDEDEPDTNWEALRDWFLAHLAQPFPTPSQCRRLVKECHIDSEELNGWLECMRELTHWNDLFSSWAHGDQHVMKELMKLVQKEIDLGIPEHRCRTSSIQRVEVDRLRQTVHKVYKPGPRDWYEEFDDLIDSDEEEVGSKENEYDASREESMWPPSDDDDAQELTAVDPDYGLTTFFDEVETPVTSPIRPSNSPPTFATFANAPKGSPPIPPISALQQEGREWLDKLERVEAEAETAYAEMERIAIKLENGGDESVAVKLEAAEIRFVEAQKKEEEVATAAVLRMQALQAQAKRAKVADQPNVKEEYVEPTILLGVKEEYVEPTIPLGVKEEYVEPTILWGVNGPTIKSEIVEVLVPTVKVEIDPKSDAVDLKASLANVEIEESVEITLKPLVKPEPSNCEVEAKGDTMLVVVEKTDLATKVEAEEREIAVEVSSRPSLTLKPDPDAPEVQPLIQELTVRTDPKVKEEPKTNGELTSPLILPSKSEPATVVFGTFQPLEPEEIEELVASIAPLSATIVQLDPAAIVVPPGLIDLSKSRAYAQASEEQQVVVAEPVKVGSNDELVIVPISFSLEEVVPLPASSSMLPQVQILPDPSTTPAHPTQKASIPPPVPTTPRCIREMPRRTSSRLSVLHGTPPQSTSVPSTPSASGSYSGSSACSSDSGIVGDTTPMSSPIAHRFIPQPPSQRTKALPSKPNPTSPSQRKRKRAREEEASQCDPSNPHAGRPMKRAKGFQHATLRTEFVPPPLPKVSPVSESRKSKRKRHEESEDEPRVIKRARVLCHVNATQQDHLEHPCHSLIGLVLDPTQTPQPSPKLENVSVLPVVKYTCVSLEEIEKKLNVAVEDGPHPIVEEIKNLSLEALSLMTDQEFSALICSSESWELKLMEYEPNDELFEDPPPLPPEPMKVLLVPPSPPMSPIVAQSPAECVAPGPQPEVECPVEPISVAPAGEIVVKQEPIEPSPGLVLSPVLPCTVQTTREQISVASRLVASASDARDSITCEAPSLTDSRMLTRPRPPKPPLVRQTRTKRAVGMMDTLSLSGERVTPPRKGSVRVVQVRGGRARMEDGARTLQLPVSPKQKRLASRPAGPEG